MSTNPVLVAAEPALVAVLKAVLAFNANIGTDPTKWVLTVPGALTILLGTAQLQIPALAQAEAGQVQAEVNSKISQWIAKFSPAV